MRETVALINEGPIAVRDTSLASFGSFAFSQVNDGDLIDAEAVRFQSE